MFCAFCVAFIYRKVNASTTESLALILKTNHKVKNCNLSLIVTVVTMTNAKKIECKNAITKDLILDL